MQHIHLHFAKEQQSVNAKNTVQTERETTHRRHFATLSEFERVAWVRGGSWDWQPHLCQSASGQIGVEVCVCVWGGRTRFRSAWWCLTETDGAAVSLNHICRALHMCAAHGDVTTSHGPHMFSDGSDIGLCSLRFSGFTDKADDKFSRLFALWFVENIWNSSAHASGIWVFLTVVLNEEALI